MFYPLPCPHRIRNKSICVRGVLPMNMNNRFRLLSLLVASFLLWGLINTPLMASYFASVQRTSAAAPYPATGLEEAAAVPVFAAARSPDEPQGDTELLDRIKREAAARRIPPVNAVMDRIWKAIPGYNGLEVDVDKTFRLAKAAPPGSPIPYVYKEVAPAVGLKDLGARPIYRGNPKKPMVSLMINVAWGEEYLPGMLATLKKENVHATFFFDGTWLSKNIAMAKEIGAQGHELSNHAYTHPAMSRLSRAQAAEEIRKTERLLKEQLGVKNTLFAPPSGDYDQETVEIAREMNLYTVLWTIDTVDWRKPGPEWIIRRISSKLEPGALILMHPTDSSSKALDSIILAAKKKGLALGTVSELISPNRVPELETNLHK